MCSQQCIHKMALLRYFLHTVPALGNDDTTRNGDGMIFSKCTWACSADILSFD